MPDIVKKLAIRPARTRPAPFSRLALPRTHRQRHLTRTSAEPRPLSGVFGDRSTTLWNPETDETVDRVSPPFGWTDCGHGRPCGGGHGVDNVSRHNNPAAQT